MHRGIIECASSPEEMESMGPVDDRKRLDWLDRHRPNLVPYYSMEANRWGWRLLVSPTDDGDDEEVEVEAASIREAIDSATDAIP